MTPTSTPRKREYTTSEMPRTTLLLSLRRPKASIATRWDLKTVLETMNLPTTQSITVMLPEAQKRSSKTVSLLDPQAFIRITTRSNRK